VSNNVAIRTGGAPGTLGGADGNESNNVGIGRSAIASGDQTNNVAVGARAFASGNSVALGGGFVNLTGGGSPNFFDPIGGALASGANSVAIGAAAADGTALGAQAQGASAIAIGTGSNASDHGPNN